MRVARAVKEQQPYVGCGSVLALALGSAVWLCFQLWLVQVCICRRMCCVSGVASALGSQLATDRLPLILSPLFLTWTSLDDGPVVCTGITRTS